MGGTCSEITIYNSGGDEALLHVEGEILHRSGSAAVVIDWTSRRVCACQKGELCISERRYAATPEFRTRDVLFGGLQERLSRENVWADVDWPVCFEYDYLRGYDSKSRAVAYEIAREHLARKLLV